MRHLKLHHLINIFIPISIALEVQGDANDCLKNCVNFDDHPNCLVPGKTPKEQDDCPEGCNVEYCKQFVSEEFSKVITEALDDLSFSTKENITNTKVGFNPLEKANLQLINKCTDDYKVEKVWFLEAKQSDDDEFCETTDLPLGGIVTEKCVPYWTSFELQGTFYGSCLRNFPRYQLFKRSRSSIMILDGIGFDLRKSEIKNADAQVGGGSALIAGGLLGLILAPFTFGGSIYLAATAAGLAVSGSIATLASQSKFGNDVEKSIAEAKEEFNSIQSDANDVNTLLALYTQSNYDANESQLSLGYNYNIRDTIQQSVRRIALTKKLAVASFLNVFTKIPWDSLYSVVQRKLQIKKLASTTAKLSSFPVKAPINSFATQIAAAVKSKTGIRLPPAIKSPLNRIRTSGPWLKLKTVGNVAFKSIGPLFDIGIGIYNVIQGTAQYKRGLSNNIRAASKELSYKMDNLINVYDETLRSMGITIEEKTYDDHNLYLLDVFLGAKPSKFKLLIRSGNKQCWTDTIVAKNKHVRTFDLGKCDFSFNTEKTNITAAAEPGYELNITSVHFSTAGRYVPTISCNETIFASYGKRSNDYSRCGTTKSLSDIRIHTATDYGSGTDASISIALRVFDTTNDNTIQQCQTDILDKPGKNDFERGSIESWKGPVLKNCGEDISDIVDGICGVNRRIEAIVKHHAGDSAWKMDLLKFYFTGNPVEKSIITCRPKKSVVGNGFGVWLDDIEVKFECEVLKQGPNNLERIDVHVCDSYYAPTDSYVLKMKLCSQKNLVNKEKTIDFKGECCTTNGFGYNDGTALDTQNKWVHLDGNTLQDDGGQHLGECEGHKFSGPNIYAAVYNHYYNWGCIDGIKLYGTPETSIEDIPFNSCGFEQLWFTYNQSKIGDNDWTYWKASSVQCSFNDTYSINKIQIKVCEHEGNGGQGSSNAIQAVIRNEGNGKNCTTTPLNGPFYAGQFKEFLLNNECANIEIGNEVSMWIVNVDKNDDAICLEDIYFDTAKSTDGGVKQYQCRFDDSKPFETWFQGTANDSWTFAPGTIPLTCK